MSTHLIVKEYVQLLKEKGFFLLGEPMVRYKIFDKKEYIAFFTTYDLSNIHAVINEIELVEDSRKVNKVLAAMEGNMYSILTLEQFLQEHSSRMVNQENVISLKKSKPYSNRLSLLKDVSVNILKQEYKNTNDFILKQSLENLDYFFYNIDVSTKAEQIIYLSKVHDLDQVNLATLTDLPLSWLIDAVPVSSKYQTITLPSLHKTVQANRQIYPI
jgi:hypothetical protein